MELDDETLEALLLLLLADGEARTTKELLEAARRRISEATEITRGARRGSGSNRHELTPSSGEEALALWMEPRQARTKALDVQ